jgi:plasminogen activator inhibitor 1 RNA-binding protein
LEELKRAEEEAKKVQAKDKLKKDKAALKTKSIEKPAPAKAAVQPKTMTTPAPVAAGQPSRTTANKPMTGGRGGNRGGASTVTFATDAPNHRETGDNRSFIKHSAGGNNPGFNAGSASAGGGNRGNMRGARSGSHPFDRHSGSRVTGVKSVEKRQGSGPHNWGSTNDQIEGDMEGAAEAAKNETKESPSKEEGAAVEGAEEVGENDATAAQPGVAEMTLNEYLAKDESERSRLGNYLNKGQKEQGKKKAQRVDLDKVLKDYQQVNGIKGVTVYQKGAGEDGEESEEDDLDDGMHGNAKNRQTVDFRINYGTTRGGASGNRRGARGGGFAGPRGGGRGASAAGAMAHAAAINLDSKDDFPALG